MYGKVAEEARDKVKGTLFSIMSFNVRWAELDDDNQTYLWYASQHNEHRGVVCVIVVAKVCSESWILMMHRADRRDKVFRTIKTYEPHVVGTQEALELQLKDMLDNLGDYKSGKLLYLLFVCVIFIFIFKLVTTE